MKKMYFLGIFFILLNLGFPSVVQADEKDTKPNTAEPIKAKLLHFGSMGGLLPKITDFDLQDPESEGAQFLKKYCDQCHNMPGPGLHTAKEWGVTFWRMFWRMHLIASQNKGFVAPDYHQGNVIFQYLSKYAMKAVRHNEVKADAPGAKPYMRICYQCHQLPDPKMHAAKDWRATARKMNDHMRAMGKLLPTKAEFNEIVSYLEANAKK